MAKVKGQLIAAKIQSNIAAEKEINNHTLLGIFLQILSFLLFIMSEPPLSGLSIPDKEARSKYELSSYLFANILLILIVNIKNFKKIKQD